MEPIKSSKSILFKTLHLCIYGQAVQLTLVVPLGEGVALDGSLEAGILLPIHQLTPPPLHHPHSKRKEALSPFLLGLGKGDSTHRKAD